MVIKLKQSIINSFVLNLKYFTYSNMTHKNSWSCRAWLREIIGEFTANIDGFSIDLRCLNLINFMLVIYD